MSDPTVWGQLAKALDDAQTILEAIDEKITAHKEDVDAHAETDQSLDAHKSEDVLDHPAGSVLADKETFTETVLKTAFETLEGWTESGDTYLEEIGNAVLYIEHGVTTESKIYVFFDMDEYFANPHRNSMCQTTLKITETGNPHIYWGPSNTMSPTYGQGYGFCYDSPTLYGRIWNMGSYKSVELTDVDVSYYHVYRAVVNADENQVEFYVDGVLKGIIEDADDVEFRNKVIMYDAEVNIAGDSAEINVKNCLLATKTT